MAVERGRESPIDETAHAQSRSSTNSVKRIAIGGVLMQFASEIAPNFLD
ncbi:hypothetical protein RMSM_02170 [Rhodopirellula maiorica SM1]|uniref:Uncharacterized protein n=1 Tax=Rhodopirellula maiorica SM1 TaxID=1265738 RepID=M5RNM1_9BACT|nr:hypothetical protein RMSM_02170 [Rhodopirellula maiorica SM1]